MNSDVHSIQLPATSKFDFQIPMMAMTHENSPILQITFST